MPSDPTSAASSAAATTARLRRRLDPALPVWMLVDPMVRDPMGLQAASTTSPAELRSARERLWQRSVAAIELPASLGMPPSLHPYLVSLDDVSDALLDEGMESALLERTESRAGGASGTGRAAYCFGGWLQGDADAARAAALLGAMARLHAPRTLTSARCLRVADARTLDSLLCVLGRDTLAGAMAPLRRWVWLDSCAHVEAVEAPEGTTPRAVTFDSATWRRFALGHLVHPTLARWLGELDARNRPWQGPTADALCRSEAAVGQASNARMRYREVFRGDDDLIAWAVMTLLEPGFDTDGHWQALLAEAAVPVDSFNIMCRTVVERMATSPAAKAMA